MARTRKNGTSAGSEVVEILVAEDSATQAEQLRHLLEGRGYSVTLAIDGKQALAAALARKPTLVISDIVMPEMDGFALCKAIKSDPKLADVPVLLVTSLSSIQDIVQGLDCGADNFVRKPYDPKGLLDRIDYLLLNRRLRKGRKVEMGLQVTLAGKKHFITYDREQILDMLVSSYEQAIQVSEELRAREKEIRSLNASLTQRAGELEVLNRDLESFSYSVSHDLRAPLRAIDGYALMLEEDYGARLDDEGRRLLQVVRASSRQMGQLIDDLLAFSRIGRAEPRKARVDMTGLAREAIADLAPAHPKARVELGNLPAAPADRALLKQVWVNLIGNALKYSARQDSPQVEIAGRVEEAESVYWVRDNGAGFDMKYYDKLFGVFQRLHREDEFEGTGVGLAIVQRIVSRHGGRVWAEGKVDGGAAFYFSLPKGTQDGPMNELGQNHKTDGGAVTVWRKTQD